jgi:predicted ferric reductase
VSPLGTVIRGLVLICLYLLASVGPLAFMFVGPLPPRRPFLVELSVALGFIGLSLMGLQFILVGRFRAVGMPFGIDVLVRFHRQISFLALGFILAHPILLILENAGRYLPLLLLGSAPWRARFAVASVALLGALIGLSLWRRWLRIPYELWQLSHGILAIAVVGLALAHIAGVGYYMHGLVRQLLFDLVVGSMMGLLVWTRVVHPLTERRLRWRVRGVRRERGGTVSVLLQPAGHPGISFMPGQFAWLSRWPIALSQHPYSISSPSEGGPPGQLTVTVKALGRWSRGIARWRPGRLVYLDGPHGAFSLDMHQGPGYVLVAGGVGITPFFSMLGTMCVRDDVRPVILIYASQDWDSVIFREQLEELALYMPNLKIVHVLGHPPPGWTGEVGRITPELLDRHLPRRQHRRYHYFVCGPPALMDATEEALGSLGVPPDQVHSERFAVV